MNDRFKFRVWDNKYKYMNYKVLVGNTDKSDENYTAHAMYILPENVDYKTEPSWMHFDEDYDGELMQSTGLKDSERNLIYEGDIFTSPEYPFTDNGKPNYVGEVVWLDEFASFQYYLHCVNPNKIGISEGINRSLEEVHEDIKVIGNVYENPELLKREGAENA